MPITTNFLIAGTNNLTDAYNTQTSSPDAQQSPPFGVPGLDPEIAYQSGYATNGVRRLKFGGTTAADDGIRLGLEQMMANQGFNDPDVVKYMVIFTDGAWNTARTMFRRTRLHQLALRADEHVVDGVLHQYHLVGYRLGQRLLWKRNQYRIVEQR